MTPVCAAPAAYRIQTEARAYFVCAHHQRGVFAEHFRAGAAPTLHEIPIGLYRCGETGPSAAAVLV
ncbi:hypothetical protein [Glycomyces sp. NPDC048151]|uniref:hypothetical protein n=1 Tax=Glycomyces sp. NPDC048151 TaxID=3364002 RepID=UPI003722B343